MAFILLGYIGRGREDRVVTALSGLMAISVVELTCYYFTFFILLAPFVLRNFWQGLLILLTPILTQALYLAPAWNDVRYVRETALLYVIFLLVVALEAWQVFQERRHQTNDALAVDSTVGTA